MLFTNVKMDQSRNCIFFANHIPIVPHLLIIILLKTCVLSEPSSTFLFVKISKRADSIVINFEEIWDWNNKRRNLSNFNPSRISDGRTWSLNLDHQSQAVLPFESCGKVNVLFYAKSHCVLYLFVLYINGRVIPFRNNISNFLIYFVYHFGICINSSDEFIL